MNKKIINIVIFIVSAILCALLISLIIKKNISQDINESNIDIETTKNFYIGNTSLSELLNEGIDESYSNEPIEEKNEIEIFEPEKIIEKETNVENNESESKPNSEISDNLNNKHEEQIEAENLEKILENLSQQTNINKITQEDLTFLVSLVSIGDNVTKSYNEVLSYALSGNFEEGKENIKLLENNLNKLNDLKTDNSDLKKVKKHYTNGVKYFIKGFQEYFDYKESANSNLIKADTSIYNAQEYLKDFLEKYKVE